ncbi:DUF3253 domain-containing protein [Parvularcula lutaonensis]|uniref:DUF3253 domain-containing protein n=1 Tax=Parvularcula lutaonensis TaxID=491923 RepID=A0ABV7M7M0_9PROT|nr:DUF3253 domain-containing protein [Parvularcula lutaonensis]GGY41772.1 hypothetical protein GCM10007148_07980 [Parvularcula lutaonensis]
MDLKDAILSLLEEREPGKTICPSEAARRAAGEGAWRPLMKPVRQAGRELAAEGRIEVTKKGKPVDAETVKGVIRYRLKGPGNV